MIEKDRIIQRNKDGKIIYDSKIVDEMIQKAAGNVEIIKAKIVTNDAFWAIADDMRQRKEEGEFDTYMDA